MSVRARAGELRYPGRNPDVGFLNCGSPSLSVNISTHTGLGRGIDPDALRRCLDELARRAPLLVARVRNGSRLIPGAHHAWIAPPAEARDRIPLDVIDLPEGAGNEATAARCAAGANRPIDPRREPPLRFELLRRPDGDCRLVSILHHALYDGASVGFVVYAIKRLCVAAEAGRELSQVALPKITTPRDAEFARGRLGLRGVAGASRLAALWLRGAGQVVRERRFADVATPGRSEAEGARSLHRTLFVELDDHPGVGPLLARYEATPNEWLQAAVARAFFDWARAEGRLDATLPLATTFNLRAPSVDEYPLGNLETATCIELRRPDVEDRGRLLEMLVRRSRSEKGSTLPLGHYLALSTVASAPNRFMPAIVETIAKRAVLLYSYLGSDFSARYLGHFAARGASSAAGPDGMSPGEFERLTELVRDHAGCGAGYVTSAPPMGLVLTVKRMRRRLALNLSIHDRFTDGAGLARLGESIEHEIAAYASAGESVRAARRGSFGDTPTPVLSGTRSEPVG